jgi:methyltransferase
MTTVVFVISLVLGLMLAEQRVSQTHERALRAAGAIEPAGDVFRWMAVVYPGAFVVMGLEGAWRAATVPLLLGGPAWAMSGGLLLIASKALKYWAIGSLGPRWTFRVLVPRGAPRVVSGPYRFIDHPNYLAVAGELAGTAMMVGAVVTGPVTVAVMAWLMWRRVQVETRALREFGA